MMSTAALAEADLEAAWRDLVGASRGDRVFALPEWKRTWRETLGATCQAETLTVFEDGRLVALAPLAWCGSDLVFDGGADVSDYLDLISEAGRETELVPRLLAQLDRLPWQRVQLDCLRETSPTTELVRRWAIHRGYRVTVIQQTVCPVVHLKPDWEQYLTTLHKKDRHEIRRKLRRFEAAGHHEVDLVQRPDQVQSAMDDFLRLLRLSDHPKAAFMTQTMERFFRIMAERLFAAGVLRLYRLRYEGVYVAAVICFDDGRDELLLYNSGFDPAYAWLSVGLLLKVYALQDAIRLGKKTYNTLRGDERYKYDLGAVNTGLFQVVVQRNRPVEGMA